MQSHLSLEEIELYFQAGIWVAARQLPRDEVRRAVAEGRALGFLSREGDFASGEASLVPLLADDSASKAKVVVPPGQTAFACFERDREHEVWEALADDQIASAYRELGPEASLRVREETRPLALEIARVLPPSVIGSITTKPETDRILSAWFQDSALRATDYAKRVLELARQTAEAYPQRGSHPNLLERDAHRVLVRIGCRAKLGRNPLPESLAGLPAYSELVAKHASEFARQPAEPSGVAVKVGPRTLVLPLHERQELDQKDTPSEARAMIACETCRAITLIIAPITYETHDDDHYGRLELWYRSHHEGACSACGVKLEVFLRYTLTEVTGVTPHLFFFELDTVEERSGRLHASAST